MKWVPALLFTSLAALAQTSSGTITGIVTDPQQARLAGAQLRLTNEATGVTLSTQTNA